MADSIKSVTAIAEQLVNDLMLVTVLVAGEGAGAQAASLAAAGAAVETLACAEAAPASGAPQIFDLAILLAPPDSVETEATRSRIAALSSASERLLFIPATDDALTLTDLTSWFEMFAELGYQPVVEFDASFVAPGAFLVDRSATAAESELTAFAERLSTGQPAASDVQTKSVASEPAAAALKSAAIEAECAALRAEAEALRGSLEAARAALADAEARNAGWEGLRQWVARAVADGAQTEPVRKRSLLSLFRRVPADTAEAKRAREAALLRASPLFDSAWYIASNPDLAAEGGDPVRHYILIGAARSADPSPWFDTKAYLEQQPDSAMSGYTPLGHAIVSGAATAMLGRWNA